MEPVAWMREFNAAITVCDQDGVILYLNDKAIETFAKDGGRSLIGKNLLDCHPEPSRTTVKRLLEKRETNVYSIEKNGVKKLIYQAPWYEGGEFKGLVELSLPIPFQFPHFVRTPQAGP